MVTRFGKSSQLTGRNLDDLAPVVLCPLFDCWPSPDLAHVQHVVGLREVLLSHDLLRTLATHAEHLSYLVSADEAACKQDHKAILHCG